MALFDLILADLNKKIDDALSEINISPDHFSHQEDAFLSGVDVAREAAEEYLREIFPQV